MVFHLTKLSLWSEVGFNIHHFDSLCQLFQLNQVMRSNVFLLNLLKKKYNVAKHENMEVKSELTEHLIAVWV